MTTESPELSGSRYPGTTPFTDSPEDQARFFGRNKEAEELYLRVLSVPLLVQFGASGLGKTSLLQAGLFPRLRQKAFLPIMVRLNVPDEPLMDAVRRSLHESRTEGIEIAGDDQSGLWELFSSITIWKDDLLYMPVLVFDQFEEVFTLRDAEFRKALATELGALATGIPPARLQASQPPPRRDLKIVISLREDYLGALEEFSAEIPGLFHERLRLEALDEDEARAAITSPALLDGPFSSPRFELDQPALDGMVEYLKGKLDVIEAFQLQLLCRHAERIAIRKTAQNQPVRLTLNDLGGERGFESVLKNFYHATLSRIASPPQRRKAELLCETGLLGSSGQRLMLEERQIVGEHGVSPDTLKILSRERLLRRERRLDSVFYEISHDRLADSIFKNRPARLSKRAKQFIAAAAVMALAVIAFALYLAYVNVRIQKERDNGEGLISFMLGEDFLGEIRDSGRSTLLMKVQRAVLKSGGAGERSPLNEALALRNVGDIKIADGNVDHAVSVFRRALDVFDDRPSDDPDSLREKARTHERLADALGAQGHLRETLFHYDEAIAAWRRIADNENDCTNLANSLLARAGWRLRTGDATHFVEDVEGAFRVASDVLFDRKTAESKCRPNLVDITPYPNADAVAALSEAARLRAYLFNFDQDYDSAATLAREARNLNPISTTKRRNLFLTLENRGDGRLWKNPLDGYADYRAAFEGFEELRRGDPDNHTWQRERASAQMLLGKAVVFCHEVPFCNSKPSLDDAEAVTLDALAAFRALAAADPTNLTLKSGTIGALNIHARILAVKKQPEAQLARLVEAQREFDALRLHPMDAEAQLWRANLLADQSRAYLALGRKDDAQKTILQAIEIGLETVNAHPDNIYYLGWLLYWRQTEAYVMRGVGNQDAAATASAEAKNLQTRYDKFYADRDVRLGALDRENAELLDQGAQLYATPDYDAALAKFRAAEEKAREYLRLHPSAFEGYHNLYLTYGWIDATLSRMPARDTQERTSTLNAALNAAQFAVWLAPPDRRAQMNATLLEARYNFGRFLYDSTPRRVEEALQMGQEEVVVGEALLSAEPDNALYRARLGEAKCELGRIRASINQAGWEDAVRSGIVHLERAVAIEPQNAHYAETLMQCRGYLSNSPAPQPPPQPAPAPAADAARK